MYTISNQSDYGILFISYLVNKDKYIPLSQIVKELRLPSRFLARIAADLARKKIVKSREGKEGGYKLTKKFATMNLYDYLKIFERNLNIIKCQNNNFSCRFEKFCRHKDFFQKKLNQLLIKTLKKYKLKNIFINF